MEHEGEGLRMEKRDLEEVEKHLEMAGLRAGDRVLDVGCASGLLTRMMAQRVSPGGAIGIDQSPERIEMAQTRAAELGVEGVSFQVADVCELPFDDDVFDVSFSRFTFEYLARPMEALEQMKRVTRAGGRVVVADMDGNGIFHYPIPPEVEKILNRLTAALGQVGFDPMIGRKLFHLFHQAGFRRIEVKAMPHHLIAGEADAAQVENWETKLRTIRPAAVKAFPSERHYDAFVDQCLELLRREDVLSYSVTFLVVGVV